MSPPFMVLVYRGNRRLGRMRVPEAGMTARLRGCRGRGGLAAQGMARVQEGAAEFGGSGREEMGRSRVCREYDIVLELTAWLS
jgi:hypothetical protein